jgi:hypothetical protein
MEDFHPVEFQELVRFRDTARSMLEAATDDADRARLQFTIAYLDESIADANVIPDAANAANNVRKQLRSIVESSPVLVPR